MGIYGNNVRFIEEQMVINEMHIGQKEATDPNILKKILKTGFPTVGKAFVFVLCTLTTLIGIFGTIITCGVALPVFMILTANIWAWFDSLDYNYKKKNLKKLEDKLKQLKEKVETELDKNPDDKDAKKLLEAINDNMDKINKMYKAKADAKFEKQIEAIQDIIPKVLDIYPFTETLLDDSYLYLISALKVPDEIIIRDCLKDINYRSKGVYSLIDYLGDAILNYDGYELRLIRTIKDEKVYPLYQDNDGTEYILVTIESKDVFYGTVDGTFQKTSITSLANKFLKENRAVLIEADKRLGYYRLSEAPEGIIPKEFPIK